MDNHNPRVGGSSPSSGIRNYLQSGGFRLVAVDLGAASGPELAAKSLVL
jgi:hypothetical protein